MMKYRHTPPVASLFTLLLAVALALIATSSPVLAQDTMDHSIFEELQGEFTTASDVTVACLECHPDVSQEVMGTTHWTWEYTTKDGQQLGKNNVINNYCVATSSNEPRCTSCHVGYGYTNAEAFKTMDETKVDCLVCHDQTGTYIKFPAGAGDPTYSEKIFPAGPGEPYGKLWTPVDLAASAQSVGLPTRNNCGACHFNGGGGADVKHGDLDTSMVSPSFDVDVHMDANGLDFTCQTCHTTTSHKVAGSRYEMDLHGQSDLKSCRVCHENHTHAESAIDHHTDRVACQTCHIPVYAKERYVKTWWDWSSAGVLKDGTGDFEGRKVWIVEKDPNTGVKTYMSNKGSFEWGKELKPEYHWFNGNSTYITLDDSFDPNSLVSINTMQGGPDDPNSLIFPFHTFGGKQPYDANTNCLVVPNLYPTNPETAYWKNWDWAKAIEGGQASVGRTFSGKFGFVETIMYWPMTHQVSPASEALTCTDCHTADNGSLDFAALGYSEERMAFLTTFPPGTPVVDPNSGDPASN